MPELPEVETIRRSLSPRLLGRRIEGLEILWPKAARGLTAAEAGRLLAGKAIGGLSRRGKYLLLELADGDTLVFHLRMTGQLLVRAAGSPREPHTRLVFSLAGGEELRYTDVRKFGGFIYLPAGGEPPAGLAALGPEPLAEEFTPDFLGAALSGRRAPVKNVLLDQRRIAGIGNIYADEALHRAGILPARPASSLCRAEIERLHQAIRTVLSEGIADRGTTKRNYVDGDGRPGQYQARLRVYGRAGERCPGCGTKIVRMVVAGRGTYYCPTCQR
jgi:formamidopyrimidine-DNA glycosylase